MPVTTQNNVFTSTTFSEAASPLVAGVISSKGLIPLFGKTGSNGTSEVEIGLMGVSSVNQWFSRLYASTAGKSGPTGAWADEWWAVHNFLQYGGTCLIGATGSTGSYYSANGTLNITSTPLHNKALADIDVVFETGNTFSCGAAVNIATTRQDCLAIIGNNQKITGIPLSTTYSNQLLDFGTTMSSEYVVYVAGRKKFTAGVGQNVIISENNLSPDVAGCMARSAREYSLWSAPAGKIRGRILNVVSMQQVFSETDADNLIAGNVNPVIVYPGEGTFLMGNETSYASTGALSKISNSTMITYLKKELLTIAQGLLFEPNDTTTRQRAVSSMTALLNTIKGGRGISDYRVVCDETNNTDETVLAGKLVIDVYINPIYTAETLVITIINTSTSEAYYTA